MKFISKSQIPVVSRRSKWRSIFQSIPEGKAGFYEKVSFEEGQRIYSSGRRYGFKVMRYKIDGTDLFNVYVVRVKSD